MTNTDNTTNDLIITGIYLIGIATGLLCALFVSYAASFI